VHRAWVHEATVHRAWVHEATVHRAWVHDSAQCTGRGCLTVHSAQGVGA